MCSLRLVGNCCNLVQIFAKRRYDHPLIQAVEVRLRHLKRLSPECEDQRWLCSPRPDVDTHIYNADSYPML